MRLRVVGGIQRSDDNLSIALNAEEIVDFLAVDLEFAGALFNANAGNGSFSPSGSPVVAAGFGFGLIPLVGQ